MSRDADIVDYLLDELEPDARRAIEQRIAADPVFADEIERMRPVVTGLDAMPGLGWGGVEPPPLPDLPPFADLARPRRRWMPAPRPLLAAVASVAVLAVGIGIGAWVAGGGADPAGPALALERLGGAGEQAVGEARVVSGDGDGLRLSVEGLDPSPEGEFYELWLLDGPERLVSLGAFRVPESGATEVDVPLPVPVGDFAFIDVSVEPEDGDPGHSGRSVLRGPTTAT